MNEANTQTTSMVIGLDLGDRFSQACFLDNRTGSELQQVRLRTTERDITRVFGSIGRQRIALEVGTHSPWVSRLLSRLGHEVLIANPREVRLIAHSRKKSDRFDARALARIARLDPTLLAPVSHRSAEIQEDLAVVRARASLVRARTLLVNHLRGAVKSVGGRLPACSSERLHKIAGAAMPATLTPAMQPIVDLLASLTAQVRSYDAVIVEVSRRHPAVEILRQVQGVGPVTALTYVLTLETPARFAKSRIVGAYLGLAPGTRSSGDRDPQLHVTREGDPYLRQLLVQSAQYLLGPFGKDSDQRRHGLMLAKRGGKAAKKRAVVAVARKLAVLLHRLWASGAKYEALRASMAEAA